MKVRTLLAVVSLSIVAMTIVAFAGELQMRTLDAGDSATLNEDDRVYGGWKGGRIRIYFPNGEVKNNQLWLAGGNVRYYVARSDGERIKVLEGKVRVEYHSGR